MQILSIDVLILKDAVKSGVCATIKEEEARAPEHTGGRGERPVLSGLDTAPGGVSYLF